jgi:hypothetical protein
MRWEFFEVAGQTSVLSGTGEPREEIVIEEAKKINERIKPLRAVFVNEMPPTA